MKKGQVFTIAGVYIMARKPDRRFRKGWRSVIAQPPTLVKFTVLAKSK